jgi:hypothetical protein
MVYTFHAQQVEFACETISLSAAGRPVEKLTTAACTGSQWMHVTERMASSERIG